MNLRTRFRPAQPVPAQHRSGFLHLYLEIAWFGVLAASAQSFVAVYAARQGASASQIGLLTAGPAVMNLLFTLPSGQLLERRPIGRSVFWSAAFTRLFYLLWVPLPLVLAAPGQVWALVILTLLMNIPGTTLAVGFNALFAEAVPPEWRGHVAGIRNATMAIVFIAVSLLCGQILGRLPFPTGYQVVFAIGFLGAAMSTLHLRYILPRSRLGAPARTQSLQAGSPDPSDRRLEPGERGIKAPLRKSLRGLRLQSQVLRGPYGRLIAVLSAFYLAIYLAVPLFALYWVNGLGLTDRNIGLGNAVFYGCVFLGSSQLTRMVRRWGNQRVTAVGALLLSLYPAFMALSRGLELFLVASVLGGLGWSLVGGALINYLLEKIPHDRRHTYLIWYNLALNATLLAGSLLGPVFAEMAGVRIALAVFAGLRFAAALVILRWEKPDLRGGG